MRTVKTIQEIEEDIKVLIEQIEGEDAIEEVEVEYVPYKANMDALLNSTCIETYLEKYDEICKDEVGVLECFKSDDMDKLDLEKNEAARVVYLLWKRGYIDIFDEKAIGSFSLFLFSVESLWFWFLVVFVVFTSGLVLFVVEPPLVYLRYVFGGVLVLYVPGAVLLEALYPSSELEPLERFALSIGLSLAVVPLLGLVLNFTP